MNKNKLNIPRFCTIITVAIFGITYLLTAFILDDMNTGNWAQGTRAAFAWGSLTCSVVTIGMALSFPES